MRLQDPPVSLRTQCQVQKDTQIRKNQKVIENNIDELEVKNHPKKKQRIEQEQKFKLPNCPSCNQNIWLENDKGYYCQTYEYIINKQRHQIDKNVLRQDHNFSTTLP